MLGTTSVKDVFFTLGDSSVQYFRVVSPPKIGVPDLYYLFKFSYINAYKFYSLFY